MALDKETVTTYSYKMTKQEKLLKQAKNNPGGLSFDDFKTLLNRLGWVEGSEVQWYENVR